jgi:hypothetical protein
MQVDTQRPLGASYPTVSSNSPGSETCSSLQICIRYQSTNMRVRLLEPKKKDEKEKDQDQD